MVACLVAFALRRACWACCGDRWWPPRAWTPTSRNWRSRATCWRPPGPAFPGPYHWAEGGPGLAVARLASQGPGMEGADSERTERPPAGSRQVRQLRPALRGGRTADRRSRRADHLCQSQRRRDSRCPRARPGGPEPDPASVRFGGRGNARPPGGANAATSNARSPSAACARCNTRCAWRRFPPTKRARARCWALSLRFPTSPGSTNSSRPRTT